MTKLLIVTACGTKKTAIPQKARDLYRSSRIKAVYNMSSNNDMAILSSEYGLVDAGEIIKPYDRTMDEERAKHLIPCIIKDIKDYDVIVFFRGGARKAYLTCIKAACEEAGKPLVIFGFANMGGINNLPKIIELLHKDRLQELSRIEQAEIFLYKPTPLIR
jgi:hypothetical protein